MTAARTRPRPVGKQSTGTKSTAGRSWNELPNDKEIALPKSAVSYFTKLLQMMKKPSKLYFLPVIRRQRFI